MDFIKYWHKCGNTVIQITHDMEVVEQADNVIGMEDGNIFFYGTKQAFLADKNNVFRISGNSLDVRNKSALKKEEVSLSVRNLSYKYNTKDRKYGVENIKKILSENASLKAQDISNKIKKNLQDFCGNARQHDDQTLMVVKIQ